MIAHYAKALHRLSPAQNKLHCTRNYRNGSLNAHFLADRPISWCSVDRIFQAAPSAYVLSTWGQNLSILLVISQENIFVVNIIAPQSGDFGITSLGNKWVERNSGRHSFFRKARIHWERQGDLSSTVYCKDNHVTSADLFDQLIKMQETGRETWQVNNWLFKAF